MFRYAVAILALAAISLAQDTPNLAGIWSFSNEDGSSGTIVLHQSGAEFSGTWHTNGSKADSDTLIAAKPYGNTLLLTRAVDDTQQTYILTLSSDGKRLEGSGQGSLNHAKLTMQLLSAAPKNDSAPSTDHQTSPAKKPKKQTWMGIGLPPPRGTYSWAVQSVAVPGSKSGKSTAASTTRWRPTAA